MSNAINKIFSFVIIMILLFAIFLVDGCLENDILNNEIKDFKARGQLVYVNNNINYYEVLPKYEYEDSKNILRSYDDINIGTTGDIYITDRNPMNDFFITGWISNLTWIGHCGLIYSKDGTLMTEIVGNKSKEDNVVKVKNNDWFNNDSKHSVVLRVKDIDNIDKEKIMMESNKLIGCRYNYSFIFSSENSFYCSDLVTHIYNEIGVNLNSDYFFSTGSDIITNDNTYIIYYKEKVSTKEKTYYNVYYLKDIKLDK